MTELPPPVLAENGSYEKWRNEIQMWQITTTMEPKRQALAVRVKLCGKVREVALKLDAADLNNDDGMTFLINALDESFRKKTKTKWDVTETSTKKSKDTLKTDGANDTLSATDKARQRAAKLSAKLAAEGKYQTQPLSLLPKTLAEQFNKNVSVAPMISIAGGPQVKKMENGNSFAEYNINDVCARPFLTRSSTRDLISQQSGAAITLRGRFLTQEDKRQAIITGVNEKPLVLMIQANVAAKVQVALHKVTEVCRNYEKFGPENNFNNYGLTSNAVASNHHFVQEKLFVGIDNMHPDFNMKEKLAGENGANFSFMIQQTGAKVFLRGRGSSYLEANSGRESFEALHIYISHPRQDGLDMARELCESLIETVKTQYQEWTHQTIIQPGNSSFIPPYVPGGNNNLRYPTYPPPTNGFNTAYTTIPSLMSKHVDGPTAETGVPCVMALSNAMPEEVVDYRSNFKPVPVMQVRPHFPNPTPSVNEHRTQQCNMQADYSHKYFPESFQERKSHHDAYPEDEQFQDVDDREKKSHRANRRHRGEHSKSPTSNCRGVSPEMRRYRSSESKGKEHVSPRDSPNHRDTSPNRRGSSPSRRGSSPNRRDSLPRCRESSPRRKDSLPNHKDSSPYHRDSSPKHRPSSPKHRFSSPKHRDSSPKHRDSVPSHQDSSPNHRESNQRESPSHCKDSPPNRKESSFSRKSAPYCKESLSNERNSPDRMESPRRRDSSRRESPVNRKGSPVNRRENPLESPPKHKDLPTVPKEKRRFTEEPKKKRKFSEDPRLLEQAKVDSPLVSPEREFALSRGSIEEELTRTKLPPPKLQFRSKKEAAKKEEPIKPKSILKMTPPAMAPPRLPKKMNGLPKSVKISPAGLSGKKFTRKDVFAPPLPIEILKAPQAPQKALRMGALSSLSMYDDSDDED